MRTTQRPRRVLRLVPQDVISSAASIPKLRRARAEVRQCRPLPGPSLLRPAIGDGLLGV